MGKNGSSSLVSQKIKSLGAIPSPTDCTGITAKPSTEAKILQDTEGVIFFFWSLNDTGLSVNEKKKKWVNTAQDKINSWFFLI